MNAPGNILLVDDDRAARLQLRVLLEREGGYAIHEATDGAAGLRAALAAPPDLILLDLLMPGMTGYEVCSALRADARTREVPVIVLSASDESEAMVAALEAGADDFLSKPFAAPELRAKVRTITRLNRFRALAGERDRFRWLLDHSPEPLIVADDRGALVHANDRAQTLFGFAAGEAGADVAAVIGQHFQSEPVDAWAAWRGQRLPDGAAFSIFQPETPQMAARWFEVELHALDSHHGQTLLKFTNRTGAVRRELETFTLQHLISHKIRTPLNTLSPIFNFLAASEPFARGETGDLLRQARESVGRLENTLLAVLRHHAAVFAPTSTAPVAGWKPLAEVLAAAADDAGLHDRVSAPGLSAVQVAHPETIEVALGELLDHYAKFSDAGQGGVEVTLSAAGDRWRLRLFARGPGLPPDVIARLGQPYGQLERTFGGEIPGMGMGLATVRLLLRSMGGDLNLTSDPATPGLASAIVLPAHAIKRTSDDARELSAS